MGFAARFEDQDSSQAVISLEMTPHAVRPGLKPIRLFIKGWPTEDFVSECPPLLQSASSLCHMPPVRHVSSGKPPTPAQSRLGKPGPSGRLRQENRFPGVARRQSNTRLPGMIMDIGIVHLYSRQYAQF
jgi:hypothetical protein